MSITTETKRDAMASDSDVPETLAIKSIRVSGFNPRSHYDGDVSSLVASINEGGQLLHAIVLRQRADGGHEVITGARRFKALKVIRGENGVLHTGEYRIVGLSDDECIRAVVAENHEREDLSPAAEGTYLNSLANHLEGQGVKVTDDLLERKTGIDRSRISDLRALADKLELLPKAWREQLSLPANCRSSDNTDREVTLTATHWRHVRGRVKASIPEGIGDVMKQCVRGRWSSSKFKAALDALDPKINAASNTVESGGTADNGKCSAAKPADPIFVGKQVVKALRDVADRLLPLNQYVGVPAKLNAIADEIAKRVGELEGDDSITDRQHRKGDKAA